MAVAVRVVAVEEDGAVVHVAGAVECKSADEDIIKVQLARPLHHLSSPPPLSCCLLLEPGSELDEEEVEGRDGGLCLCLDHLLGLGSGPCGQLWSSRWSVAVVGLTVSPGCPAGA